MFFWLRPVVDRRDTKGKAHAMKRKKFGQSGFLEDASEVVYLEQVDRAGSVVRGRE